MYTSDVTTEEFSMVKPLLPMVNMTKPRKWSRHQIWNTILYVLVMGCQWRNASKDLVPRQTAYYYFNKWKKAGVYGKVLTELRTTLRKKIGKEETPSLVLFDSQAVKNTDSADQKGLCHYKSTNGIKRHLLVDVTGIPVCLTVTTANVGDREGGKNLGKSITIE